ncbi:MAG: response regulator [Enterocloster sp.]
MYQVIIADDEAKIRSGIANLFPWKQLGFEIAGIFSNGKEACDFALSHPVDLILSDIRMPIMNGLELSDKLLKHKKVKIIFFSGYQDFEYARQALRNGVFDYLLKPIKYDDLLNCLTRAKETLDKENHQSEKPEEENLSYYQKIINTVRNYLDTDYQTATLEQAARLVNLSPNYLSKIMKEHSDSSFSDYLLKTRMENAARMLRSIQYKQYEIAYRVGYDNPKNFSRAFHQYFHMTPSEYRSRPGQ